MRALIFDGQTVRLDAAQPTPLAREGDAIVRLSRALVSPIDCELTRGLFGYRGVLGHQFVGVVESAGELGAELIGKRVVASVHSSCGKCDLCIGGLAAHCRKRAMLGMNGIGGCLAEQFAIPARSLVAIPKHVTDEQAIFAVEVAAALHAADQLTIVGKPYISVIGDTTLALITAQIMSKLNASVRWMGWRPECVTVCEKWGLKHRLVDEAGKRADQDIVVDCSQALQGFELAMQLVRPRGKIVLKSLTQPLLEQGSGVALTPIVMSEIEVIGSQHGSIRDAVKRMAADEVDLTGLITKRLAISSGPAIIKVAQQPGSLGVAVEP